MAAALPPETGRTAETTATSRLVAGAAAASAGRLPPDRRFRYPSDGGGGGGDPEQVACAFRVLIASVFFIFVRIFFSYYSIKTPESILCEIFWQKRCQYE